MSKKSKKKLIAFVQRGNVGHPVKKKLGFQFDLITKGKAALLKRKPVNKLTVISELELD